MDHAPIPDALLADALPHSLRWSGRPSTETIKSLPNHPAVLLFIAADERPIQLLATQQLRAAVLARLAERERSSRRADVGEIACGARWREAACAFESRWWYYRVARELHPRSYRKLIAFGPSWFLAVDRGAAIPEVRVSERVWCDVGEFVGPWPSRAAAQAALEGLWDLFDLCRYPEQVRRAPRGKRCAYAEMGRCDAPCDGGAPLASYLERTLAAWRFASGGVGEWRECATREMRAAAEQQAFERAALLKQQLAFAARWSGEWAALAAPATHLDQALALPVTRRRAWKLLAFRQGHIVDGPVVADRAAVKAIAEWVPRVAAAELPALADSVRMEQTWLVCQLLTGREAAGVARWPLAPGGEPVAADAIEAELAARRKVRPVEPAPAADEPALPAEPGDRAGEGEPE